MLSALEPAKASARQKLEGILTRERDWIASAAICTERVVLPHAMSAMVSIIICSRNRCRSLSETLGSIAQMTVPPELSWELIVVDNDSSDDTWKMVEEFARKSGLNVRYVVERRHGLGHARNRGMEAARGEILAFTDDDVLVGTAWLEELAREFERDTEVAMVFGRTKLYASDQSRLSIKDSPLRKYHDFPCSPWEVGPGNNMSLRRAIATRVGWFDTALGAGTRVGSAEDSDYVYRVLKAGHRILYSPAPVVYHNHGRLVGDEEMKTRMSYTRGRGAFYCKHILRADQWAVRFFLREIRGILWILLKRCEKRYTVVLTLKWLLEGFALRLRAEIEARIGRHALRPGLAR